MPGPGCRDRRSTAKMTARMPRVRSSCCSWAASRSISLACWRWIWMLDCQVMMASSSTENTTNISTNMAVRRTVVVRHSCRILPTDHVAGAADGVQQGRGVALVDLGAQPRHVHVDDVGLGVEMVVPDVLQQHGAGDHLAGVLHQILEQPELARLQLDGLAVALHGAAEAVELQAPHLVTGGGLGGARAAGQHLDAGEQFGKGVGF